MNFTIPVAVKLPGLNSNFTKISFLKHNLHIMKNIELLAGKTFLNEPGFKCKKTEVSTSYLKYLETLRDIVIYSLGAYSGYKLVMWLLL